MNRNGWTQRACERLVRHFEDETGKSTYVHADIAKWAKEERGYAMPEPPTDVEMLTMLLQQAAVKSKRRDETQSIEYRAHLASPELVKGEWKMTWRDADAPSTSPEKVLASARQRREQAINILAGALATILHELKKSPQMELFDLSISMEEINWRLFGRNLANDEQQDVG